MGQRGNIVIQDDPDGRVYLYTHWRGESVEPIARKALASEAGRRRWDDGPYLARIVFDTLTECKSGETGFGISPKLCDNEHEIVVLDTSRQLAWLENDKGTRLAESVSFEEFAAGAELPGRAPREIEKD